MTCVETIGWVSVPMTPELARAWLRVGRDILIYLMATVILTVSLVLYVVRDEPPDYLWIGAAAFLYGLAPALRADEWLLRNGNGKNGNGRSGKNGEGAPDRQ